MSAPALTKDWVNCIVVREISVPADKACLMDETTLEPFGATLGEPYAKWSHFGGRYVSVPAETVEEFSQTFKSRGWMVCTL